MIADEALYERIASYLDGNLPPAMAEAFAAEMAADSELAREVEMQREVLSAIQNKAAFDLEDKLKKIGSEFSQSESRTRGGFRWYYAAAATVLLLISIGLSFYQWGPSKESGQELFAQNFEPSELYVNLRSGKSDQKDILEEAFEAYEAENYAASLPLFQAALEHGESSSQARFYYANALLQQEKLTLAIIQLNQLERLEVNLFSEQTQWLLALAHLGQEDHHQAKIVLNEIIELNGTFADQAEILLEEL